MNLFTELSQVNRAYCASLGLAAAELYGIEPNEAEFATHRNIAAGVPAESAGMFSAERMEAERIRTRKIVVSQQREIRLRNARYAPGRFIKFANSERFIRSKIGA